MSLSIAVGLLCKSNAIVLAAAAFALIALRLLHQRRRPQALIEYGLAATVMVAGLLLSFGRNFYYWWRGGISDFLIGNINVLPDGLRVTVGCAALCSDLPVFLANPWISPWLRHDNADGRDNFWNYLLRSSLSSEFSFDGSLQRVIAFAWGGMASC